MGLGSFSNMLVSQKAKKGIGLPVFPRTITSSPPLLGPSQRWLTLSHPSAFLASNPPVAAADLPPWLSHESRLMLAVLCVKIWGRGRKKE